MLDRKLWKAPFKHELPSLPCSNCAIGFLHPIPDMTKEVETGGSREAHEHEAWDIDWIESRFTALYRCNNPKCAHVVGLTGIVRHEEGQERAPNGEWDRTAIPIYTPVAFSDPLPVIRVDEHCPHEVLDDLKRSFSLYWMDGRACATAIRSAVEALLDDQAIPRDRTSPAGKKVGFLPLKARLDLFEAKDPEPGKLLGAIRVIGNIGTHAEPVSDDDLLSGYEILEHAIDVIYSGKAKRVAGLADDILKRLGS